MNTDVATHHPIPFDFSWNPHDWPVRIEAAVHRKCLTPDHRHRCGPAECLPTSSLPQVWSRPARLALPSRSDGGRWRRSSWCCGWQAPTLTERSPEPVG